MGNANFLISTGRTSTQNIASILKASLPEAVIDHEALGPNYLSRKLYRNSAGFERVLKNRPAIEKKFAAIETTLSSNQSYFEVGWPVYAWLPYLSSRFTDHFRFMHLVRNPYKVAASLTTHGLFVPNQNSGRAFQNKAMLHATDSRIKFKDVAANADAFSPLERNLFHWLELNQFVLEHHHLAGFQGLVRFEDINAGKDDEMDRFLKTFAGLDATSANTSSPPVDRHQRTLNEPIGEITGALRESVDRLAIQLGYKDQELRNAQDITNLQETYATKRLE